VKSGACVLGFGLVATYSMPLNLIGEYPRDCESSMERCRAYMVLKRSTSGATSPEAADADARA
jgi:hypothetical protein